MPIASCKSTVDSYTLFFPFLDIFTPIRLSYQANPMLFLIRSDPSILLDVTI